MNLHKYRDIFSGGAVALFALTGLFYFVPVGVKSPPNINVPALAPVFWPSIILWLMLGLAVVVLVQGVFSVMRPEPDNATKHTAPQHKLDTIVGRDDDASTVTRTARTITALVLLFVYQALIEVIGMMMASILACVAFSILSGERRYHLFLPVAVLLPILLYYFFTKVAAIPIPLGIFETLGF